MRAYFLQKRKKVGATIILPDLKTQSLPIMQTTFARKEQKAVAGSPLFQGAWDVNHAGVTLPHSLLVVLMVPLLTGCPGRRSA